MRFVSYVPRLLLALAIWPGIGGQAVADPFLDEARRLHRQGQPEQALSVLLEATPKTKDDSIRSRLLKGVIQAQLEKTDEAIATFEQLSRDFPDLPQPQNNLAVIYAKRGMNEQARNALLRAIELQPRHSNAHQNLGDLYIHMAAQSYTRAYELNPDDSPLKRKIAQTRRLIGAEAPKSEPKSARPKPVSPPIQPVQSGKAFGEPGRCFAVGPIRGAGKRGAVSQWLSKQAIGYTAVRRDKTIGTVYQVYMPPTGSSARAAKLLKKVKSKGIRDVAVIHTGVLKTGLSLGVFNHEHQAKRLQNRLKEKGFDQADYRTQNPVHKRTWFILPHDVDKVRRESLLSQFPGLRMEAARCE